VEPRDGKHGRLEVYFSESETLKAAYKLTLKLFKNIFMDCTILLRI
jgi:hypothetical protein